MPSRPSAFLVLIAALALVAGLAPTWGTADECEGIPHCGPYNDYPGDPCNGPNDPFCNGGGGGGGGSTGQCQVCELTCYGNGTCTLSCEDNEVGEAGKSDCEVTEEGEEVSCETWGTTCVSA